MIFKNFALTSIAIFVALDVFGTLPLYFSMTRDVQPKERKKTLKTSMVVAFVTALFFLFLGQTIFRYLGITLTDFKLAGGLILLLIALADLVGPGEAATRISGSTGIVPLAVPLITGPGVLTTLIIQAGSVGYWITVAALLVNYALAWLILMRSGGVTRLIGHDGTVVLSKIAGLLLAAISIAMIRAGIFESIVSFRSHLMPT